MKRRVIENFPAERLPRELLGSIDPKHLVRIIIEDEERSAPSRSFMKFFGAAKEKNTSVQEAVDRIRGLRDEWDE